MQRRYKWSTIKLLRLLVESFYASWPSKLPLQTWQRSMLGCYILVWSFIKQNPTVGSWDVFLDFTQVDLYDWSNGVLTNLILFIAIGRTDNSLSIKLIMSVASWAKKCKKRQTNFQLQYLFFLFTNMLEILIKH